MKRIWYLLKYPEGCENEYTEKSLNDMMPAGIEEVVCFRYQCMMRYGGKWHLENRILLPGYVFLFGMNISGLTRKLQENRKMKQDISLTPCAAPYLKGLCQKENVIEISRGIIKDGIPIVIGGPLKGYERLIRKIDRHKRTAIIEIPLENRKKQVTVGLEIYEKRSN